MKEVDLCVYRARKWIGPEAELGFISTFICGLFVHLFVYVNHYPTYSGLVAFVENGSGFALEGRWFSTLLKNITGVATIPFFLGILSLLFWSLSFAIIVKIFNLQSRTAIILTSAIYISFPTVAAMNCFMYMAHCFAAGTFLACLGVYFISKHNKYTYIVGVLCLILALATYQAVLTVAMVLIFMIVAFDIIDGKKIKEIWIQVWKYTILILFSLGLYYIIFKMYLCWTNVESYRDFNISSESVLRGIIKCYGGSLWFLGWGSVFSLPVGRLITILTFASICLILGILIKYKWNKIDRKSVRILMLVGLLLLCPLVSNYTFLVNPDEARTYRQFGSYAIIYLVPIILCEYYEEDIKNIISIFKIKNTGIVQYFVAILAIGSVMFFCIVDNIAYMNSHILYEKEYSLVVRVVDRIENTPGYEQGMPVILMFSRDYFSLYEGIYESQLDKYIPGMEQRGGGFLTTPTGFVYFIQEFIQTKINIQCESLDEEMLIEMRKWPENGCTQIRDGKLYLWLT